MKMDVTKLSYSEVENLLNKMSLEVKQFTKLQERVMLEVEKPSIRLKMDCISFSA